MANVDVEITHPDRVLFPAGRITKRDLVTYYDAVAETMLVHLRGRALNVQRFPRGIGEKGFIQQDFADTLQDWMGRVEVDKEGGTVVHLVADRPETLRWLANQSAITLHAWQSRQDNLNNPDRLVFDLDPSDSDFAVVRAAAHAVAGVLDDLGLARYVQTTGSRGLHVVVPVKADTDFDTARQFARDVAEVVVADDPDHRTVEARKEKRGGRVYLDIMRNAYAQTAVAPYSVRAREGAPVATPLEWDELDGRDLRPDRFTIGDLPKRLAGQRDPWANMSRHARSLAGPRDRLAKLRA
ncbi:MAG: non-homologous end-joining DNA ligase [Mycobacterium sp.]|uniref:non-homologous end-joining DNA ligase n=1 Tax=Mycobacterium sp. TaxID=1785 RepID=UPI001EB22AA2|nr:non-homologous end-joining DNA ligase [Mycobacterium sp.]MBV8785948.1 non-homologous end-joining DNA ligase [Mycobacterium sp.]